MLDQTGPPSLRISSGDSDEDLAFLFTDDKEPTLSVNGAKSLASVILTETADGRAQMLLCKKTRAVVRFSANAGQVDAMIANTKGGLRSLLLLEGDKAPMLRMLDAQFRPRVDLADDGGRPLVRLSDPDRSKALILK
jgi:hypothetical protein